MGIKKQLLTKKLTAGYAPLQEVRKERRISCNILIVCEGTKTEPQYFKKFQSFNNGTIIYELDLTLQPLGRGAAQVVDKAIELKLKADRSDKPYDRVWAVFDKDDIPVNDFNDAILHATNEHISCAWSNEAFELWYLNHFQYRDTPMSRDDYQKAITQAVNASPNYKGRKKYKYIRGIK